jgi:hypothetical protein
MKTISIKKDITIPQLIKVDISNELMGTNLVQSEDNAIHITADLYISMSDESEELTIEDFIDITTDEAKGNISIDIQEVDSDDCDIDISHRSIITVAIPANIKIAAETDNHFIVAADMNNEFELSSENGSLHLKNCQGTFLLKNENGSIKMENLQGNITIEQENGSVSSDNANGETLDVSIENGSVKMRDNFFVKASIKGENGNIFYECMPMGIGSIDITNENGNINLALAPTQGFKLEAHTEMGRITNNFMGAAYTASGEYSFNIGDEMLGIDLTTENGSIKIISSDMVGGDYLKGKLEYIKELLKDNSETGMAEARKLIAQLITTLTKMKENVNEEAAKEKIRQALEYLNSWKERINDPEMKTKVKESIDIASNEINAAMVEAMKAAQEAFKVAHEKFNSDFKPQFDKHILKGKEMFKQFRNMPFPPFPPFQPHAPHAPHATDQKEAMQDKARMKILEMLEAGKITSEEAERLLKAIH